jgi:hypothetical protein
MNMNITLILRAVKTTGTKPTALKNSSYTAEYALEIIFHHQGPLSLQTNRTRVYGSVDIVNALPLWLLHLQYEQK